MNFFGSGGKVVGRWCRKYCTCFWRVVSTIEVPGAEVELKFRSGQGGWGCHSQDRGAATPPWLSRKPGLIVRVR